MLHFGVDHKVDYSMMKVLLFQNVPQVCNLQVFFEKEIIYSTVKNYHVFWNIFIDNFGKSKFFQN